MAPIEFCWETHGVEFMGAIHRAGMETALQILRNNGNTEERYVTSPSTTAFCSLPSLPVACKRNGGRQA